MMLLTKSNDLRAPGNQRENVSLDGHRFHDVSRIDSSSSTRTDCDRVTYSKRSHLPPDVSASISQEATCSGMLEKLSRSTIWPVDQWKRRYFELRGHYLLYYTDLARASTAAPDGCIDIRKLSQAVVRDQRCLVLSSRTREIKLRVLSRPKARDSSFGSLDEKMIDDGPSASDWLHAIEQSPAHSRSRSKSASNPDYSETSSGFLQAFPEHGPLAAPGDDDDDDDDIDTNLAAIAESWEAPSFSRALRIIGVDGNPSRRAAVMRAVLLFFLIFYFVSAIMKIQIAENWTVSYSLKFNTECTPSLAYRADLPPPCILILGVQVSPIVVLVPIIAVYIWLIRHGREYVGIVSGNALMSRSVDVFAKWSLKFLLFLSLTYASWQSFSVTYYANSLGLSGHSVKLFYGDSNSCPIISAR